MKNLVKRVPVLGIMLATMATGTVRGQTSTALQEWRFDSHENPASPELTSGNVVKARALVTQGRFSSGWIAQDTLLGSSRGIWDLGRRGTITLNQWTTENGPATASYEVTVKVTQWYDGGIYGALATVDVPGARLANRSQVYAASESIGNWVTDETHWTIDVGATVDAAVLTSPENGVLIDKVSIEVPVSIAPPPSLTIQTQTTVSNGVEISWPALSASGWQLEANTDLNNMQGWAPVVAQPKLVGDRSVVSVQKEGTLFFRLKQQQLATEK